MQVAYQRHWLLCSEKLATFSLHRSNIKERFFADTEGYLYQTTGSCLLPILMKPLRNAPNEDLSFSNFQMLKNNVEMQIPPGTILPHNYLLVKKMVLQCIVNACNTNENKKKILQEWN